MGTVTASHKILTLRALSNSLNAGTAKRGCLSRGKAFESPPAVCPPERSRPFARSRSPPYPRFSLDLCWETGTLLPDLSLPSYPVLCQKASSNHSKTPNQKTREGCGCFRCLFGGSRGKLRERPGKIAGKCFTDRKMPQNLGFRAPGQANLPGTLGRHCLDLVSTFHAGCFLKSTAPAFSSFSDPNQQTNTKTTTVKRDPSRIA